jgi:trehalose 6-phosphate phosphatase
VSDPDAAVMPEGTRRAVRALAQLFPTAIISGRGREKVQAFVGLDELYYAGSHGMDIVGPQAAAAAGSDGGGASGTASCSDCSGSAGSGSACTDGGSCLAFQPAAQYGPLMDQVYHQLCEGKPGPRSLVPGPRS